MAGSRWRKRKSRIIRLGAVMLLLLLFLGFIFLFRIREVKVYGNERHSAEEISSGLMDNILAGNMLHFLWEYRNGDVPDSLPFLATLHVQMKSPWTVEAHVTEKTLAACLDQGQYIYIDQDGTVLEITDERYDGLPLVTGVAVGDVVLYQKLPTQSSAQLRTILTLTQLLTYHELSVDEIRFGDNLEITVFAGDVEVQLGQDEYLEEKIANLGKILPKLEGQSGVLHLDAVTGRNEQIPFTPSTAVTGSNPEGSGDTGGEDGSGDAGGSGDGSGDTGGDGSGDGSGDAGSDGSGDDSGDGTGEDGQAPEGEDQEDQDSSPVIPMVFNSYGTLVYNVRIMNGIVVDEYGNQVPGVTVNEDGNVVDAYMNVIDPNTGDLVQ